MRTTGIPSGESPLGTGESPVPPSRKSTSVFGLKTYAGDLEPHRLVNANGRLAPFGFNFAPWLLCVLALNSDCMVTAERAGAAGDGRGNSDKNSPQDAEATRVTLAWGASLLVEEPSESRMRENRPSGLMRGGARRSWALRLSTRPLRLLYSTF